MSRSAGRKLDRVTDVTDVAAWTTIEQSLGADVLQSWWWGDLKARHGWTPRRLAVLDADGQPCAAAQILFRHVGPVSVAYAPRGPAAAPDAPDAPDALSALTVGIDQLCWRARSVAALIEPSSCDLALPSQGSLAWEPTDVLLQPRRTIKVRVDRPDDDLLAAMKPKTRYNVRLATRRGVVVRRGSIDDLPAFYAMLAETSMRDRFGIHEIEYFRDMLDVFGDDAALLLAELDGEPAAGALVVRHGTEAVYMYGASATRLQRHMAAYLIQFEAMRWARSIGCVIYDLWGIPDDDAGPESGQDDGRGPNVRAGLWGVYRFKQGFGGEVVRYPGVLQRVYAPPLMRLWRRVRPNLV